MKKTTNGGFDDYRSQKFIVLLASCRFFLSLPRRIRNLFAIKFDISFTSKYRISSVIIRSVMIADNKYNTDLQIKFGMIQL